VVEVVDTVAEQLVALAVVVVTEVLQALRVQMGKDLLVVLVVLQTPPTTRLVAVVVLALLAVLLSTPLPWVELVALESNG
tara:strand:- start:191 stop:430 length:240 start_codon:yes stop_codon:yes gene_type:complete